MTKQELINRIAAYLQEVASGDADLDWALKYSEIDIEAFVESLIEEASRK